MEIACYTPFMCSTRICKKISQIRDMVESRLDDVDEEGTPSFESIGDIEAVLRQHFTLLKIPRAEIMW